MLPLPLVNLAGACGAARSAPEGRRRAMAALATPHGFGLARGWHNAPARHRWLSLRAAC
jgi:hypothetical protein